MNKAARPGSGLSRFLRLLEHGEDSSFEFTTMIVPMVLMILMITFATLVRAAQMPVWTAASECARQGIASETEIVGRQQALDAAMQALLGYTIDPASIRVNIITVDWLPGSPVTCQVSYNIDTTNVAFFSELTNGHVSMAAEVTLRIEPFTSHWPVTPIP
jgi:hypothetical protein